MGVISHGIYRPFPGEETPEGIGEQDRTLLIRKGNDDREEESMGEKEKCLECGNEEAVARGLGRKCYDKLKAQGTLDQKYPKGGKKSPTSDHGPERSSISGQFDKDADLRKPEIPLPGDLFIVAKIPLEQIRVMTVEQLREMCKAGHC